VFLYELQQLLLLGLGQAYGLANEGWQGPWFEFYGVVLGSRWGKLPFLSLLKDVSIISILEGDTVQSSGLWFSFCEDAPSGERLSG
jgi:hypothetical protein